MKNKKRIVISGITLFLVTIMLLGLTYAYYKTRINGNSKDKSISVVSKKLEITYTDGNGVIEGTGIEPGYTLTKTFSVENTGDEKVNYKVYFENVVNTFTRSEDWTYKISCQGTSTTCDGIDSTTFPTSEKSLVLENDIASKETQTYTLTLTYANLTDIDQSIDMGKSLSGKINITKDYKDTANMTTSDYKQISYTLNSTTTSNQIMYLYDNIGTELLKNGENTITIKYKYYTNENSKDNDFLTFMLKNNTSSSSPYSGGTVAQSSFKIGQQQGSLEKTLTVNIDKTNYQNTSLVLLVRQTPDITTSDPLNYTWNFDIIDLVVNGISVNDKFVKISNSATTTITDTEKTIYNSKYSNKKVAVLGDSITVGTGVYSNENIVTKPYWQVVNKNLFFASIDSNGWGGSAISKEASYTDKRYTKRYQELATNNDLVMVFGGTNDYSLNAKLGTITDTASDENHATFYASLKFLMEHLKAANPSGDIVFITPTKRGDRTKANDNGYILEDYVNAIKETAKLYDVKICDLYNYEDIQTNNENWLKEYMPDKLHPNQLGHNLLGDEVSACLSSLN